MSWLKQSDAAANHPIVLRVLEIDGADDRLTNEVYGWVNRCATQSAAHDKDYIVELGTAVAMAGSISRFNELRAAALFAGYFTEVMVEIEGEQRKGFKLVEEKDLFHMILKAEKDWEKQRQADNRDVVKTGPVRLRDGDACRYCGRVVTWNNDRKSARWGSIDHVVPGEEGTIDTMVVCCGSCNSRRKDDQESTWRTLPVPDEPLIGKATATFLTDKCGIPTEPTYTRIPTNPVPPITPMRADGTLVTEESTAVEPHPVGVPAKDDAPVAVSDASIDSTTSEAPRVDDHVEIQDLAKLKPVRYVNGVQVFEESTAVEPHPVGVPAKDDASVAVSDASIDSTPTHHVPIPGSNAKSNPDIRLIRAEQAGRSRYAGSGRDGSGWVGTGSSAHGSTNTQPRDQSKKPRKRRRGRPSERKPRAD